MTVDHAYAEVERSLAGEARNCYGFIGGFPPAQAPWRSPPSYALFARPRDDIVRRRPSQCREGRAGGSTKLHAEPRHRGQDPVWSRSHGNRPAPAYPIPAGAAPPRLRRPGGRPGNTEQRRVPRASRTCTATAARSLARARPCVAVYGLRTPPGGRDASASAAADQHRPANVGAKDW